MLPKGWDIKPLSELAVVERGKFSARPRNDPKYFGGSIPFIQTGDISKANGRVTTYTQTLNESGLAVSRLFPKGTIFVTIAANIGSVAISTFDTACPDSIVAISPNDGTSVPWLLNALKIQQKRLEALATQNAQKNINLETLRPLLIPTPPKAEQDRIATILSTWDTAIEMTLKLIEAKKKLKKGLMQNLLTGKRRFPEFGSPVETSKGSVPQGWKTVRVSDLGEVLGGRQRSPKHVNGTLRPYLRVANVFDGYVDFSDVLQMPFTDGEFNRFKLLPGDILLNEGQSLELVGRSAVFFGPAGQFAFQNTLIRFRPGNEVNGSFMRHLFKFLQVTGRFAAISTKTTSIAHLGSERFAKMHVNIPSISEQTRIADFLSTLDCAIDTLRNLVAAKTKSKQHLMQKLLTGQVRVDNKEGDKRNVE